MERGSAFALFLFALLFHVSCGQVDPQITAVQGLIQRWVPSYAKVFQLELISPVNGQDAFELQSNGSFVVLGGTSGTTIASALNYYLKYYCNCQITWTGNQLALPTTPPTVSSLVQILVPMTFRYYFNVCTFGYSTVWWNYARWQQEIDWMALNGINFPLAFVGQETVFRSVYLKLGVTDEELLDFFTGPAFLPWQRMGNVNGWGGGLPISWLEARTTLQQQILAQMRSFGMKPILPAFSGHVPAQLKTLYPSANIVQLNGWDGDNFNGTFFLDPSDPLFAQIGSLFITMQESMYGTDHYYNADLFNELGPPSNNVSYLAAASKAVYNSMAAADSQTTWVMQGWFLINDRSFWQPAQTEAFLNGIPEGRLLMLDLWAEVMPAWNMTQKFYGHDFIWCMLHNFGGRSGLYGALQSIASGPAITAQAATNMVGMGLTPEAIETNVIVYDLMMEMPWRISLNSSGLLGQLDEWVVNFTIRRYGGLYSEAVSAWSLLQNTVYSCSVYEEGTPRSLMASRPDTSISILNKLYYDPSVVVQALQYLVNASSSATLAQQETFQHDIAAVTRQMLSNAHLYFYLNMMDAYGNNSASDFTKWSQLLLGTIPDTDAIVSTQEMWLVGKWIADAVQWATNPTEKAQYEFNARNQLTLWGPSASGLHDYAYKLWGGLVHDFYYPRWSLFVSQLGSALGSSFDYNTFVADVETLEWAWCIANNTYSDEPTGNAVQLAAQMLAKYAPLVLDAQEKRWVN